MITYHDRFKDAPWYEKSKNEIILIGGAGGIGSNATYSLAKTVPAQIYVVDFDKIESYNIGTQFFLSSYTGVLKVEGLQKTIQNFGENIKPLVGDIGNYSSDICISAFDNMAARKKMFNNWKKRDTKELFVDGRLRANMYEVYAVTPDKIEQYEATLFDDKDVEDDACTFKQTAYFAILIGARITHIIVNYLTNKYAKQEICNVPFMIQEVGEPFFIKTI